MPHDKDGELLEVGDKVNLPCVIKTITPGEDYCNVTVETEIPMPPENKYKTSVTVNTKQVVRQ